MIFKMKNFLAVILAIFIIAISFGIGVFIGEERSSTHDIEQNGNILDLFLPEKEEKIIPPENVDLELFWNVWNLINEKYVTSEMPTDEEKIWGAIDGLVGSLDDPYSIFLPPIEAKMFEEDVRGNFEGVGMEIGIRDHILTVIAPLKGTPAEAAGLMSGDKIIQIDETPTYDLSINESVSLIRGEKGTAVKLIVVREGVDETLEISVVRDVIEIPIIYSELRDDGIFLIELYSFSETSPALFQEAIEKFVNSGSDKLILDLRNNPGGYLEASVDIASWFLPNGKVVVRESYGTDIKEIEHRTNGHYAFDGKDFEMVILINQGSASASEILAGALSEHNVATLVGEKSFGKGSVQELIKTGGDTSLKLTIARWLTPNGVSISEEGLVPDVPVEMTFEDVEENRDPQMDKAVEILLEK